MLPIDYYVYVRTNNLMKKYETQGPLFFYKDVYDIK